MSSCRVWGGNNRCKNDQLSESAFTKHRKMPPLLRLDSTGEISSAKNRKPNQDNKKLSLRDFVGGFRMIETGSSYIGTAASYIEDFCKSKSRRDLVRSDSDTTALQYIQNMMKNQRPTMGKEQSGSFESVLSSASLIKGDTSHSAYATANTMQAPEVTQAVPGSIFSVFQNRIGNNKVMGSTKLKCEPYVPPPLKNKMATHNIKSDVRINPKLTPYNARLLEQSKNQRNGYRGVSCTNKTVTNSNCHQRCFPRSHDLISKPRQITRKNTDCSGQVSECDNNRVTNSKSSCDNTPAESNTSDSDAEISKEDQRTEDWFDYENNNLELIPIQCNVMALKSFSVPKMKQNKMNQTCDNKEKLIKPLLNSWLSQENDVDVQKADEHNNQSSQETKVLQSQCDDAALNESKTSETMCSKGKLSDTKAGQQSGYNITSSRQEFIVPHILYIRNLPSKRCRPSSKKRKRNKALTNDCDGKTEKSGKKCAQHPSNSLAFILGLDPQNEKNSSSHPFLISCDTDSSSDWSDLDSSDLEIDGADDPDFCAFNEPLNLFNLKVMCSVQPETSSRSSEIDDINLSWQLNVAIGAKEKSSSKQVRFVEDENLATVHPMVTWSYAYAAARKGPWEEMARDRGRFQRRITEGEKVLKTVLNPEHRDKIFQERFTSG